MKTLFNTIDDIMGLVPWFIAAWCLFGFATMAQAQDLTLGQRIVAQTILGEARGEGEAGMYGVACVIQERIKSKHWPNNAKDVCFQKSQFDVWTERKYVTWDDDNRAADNLDRSFVGYADHYCTNDTHNYWTKGNKPTKVIKNHKFFKLR
jgi:spore germination cell wall hydrolase CwlJ-like protein